MSTAGIWHYPATITNSTLATEFAQFAPTSGFSTTTTAGVINNFGGRLQVTHSHSLRPILLSSGRFWLIHLDGIFHGLCHRLESDVKLSSACLDTLGNQRIMLVQDYFMLGIVANLYQMLAIAEFSLTPKV